MIACGLDFGTSNSAIGIARGDDVALAPLEDDRTLMPSAVFFDYEVHRIRFGSDAISAYVGQTEGRLMRALKTILGSPLIDEKTSLGRRKVPLKEVVGIFVRHLKHKAEAFAGREITAVVHGRPVRFVDGDDQADARAQTVLETIARESGFKHIVFVPEPIAAAWHYEQTVQVEELVLIADIGGGTSDFSVMRFERHDGRIKATPLGHSGIGVAGDAFDYRIIDRVVSPRLGKGSDYVSFGKKLAIPNGYYANFARWNQLAMMKSNGDLKELIELERAAVDPAALQKLIDIIENDLGFALYRAVSAAKVALSSADEADFRFRQNGIDIEETIARADFEDWIADDVTRIAETVDEALAKAGLGAHEIDKVFLTGGTSFIPAIWKLFGARFGEDRLMTGDQFESIAYGLALIGRAERPEDWAMRH